MAVIDNESARKGTKKGCNRRSAQLFHRRFSENGGVNVINNKFENIKLPRGKR